MAVRRFRHKHGRKDRKKHADELSALLAPLEELHPELAAETQRAAGDGSYSDATIKVDNTSVKAPEELIDRERAPANVFHLDTVVLVILCAMLAFIAFIAWQISQMPTPPPK
ncbi:MAG TPA: hypothetical protein VFX96_14530 [Pyrinomonadaceae bacterium]|nr:hypothetical protein [Pyrinomonadaceae bacterium]